MADRYPLVVASGTVQEIASGDNLDLTSSNIVGLGSFQTADDSFIKGIRIGTGIGTSTIGSYTTYLGFGAGNGTGIGTYCTGIGYSSLHENTTGERNTAVGAFTLQKNTTGYRNTACGSNSLVVNTTGQSNVAVGHYALFLNTTGNYNTALGQGTLLTNVSGTLNTAVGERALYSNTSSYNTAVGGQSQIFTSSGTRNTSNGYTALGSHQTGNNNTGIGVSSLLFLVSGSDNTAVGHQAAWQVTGSYNTAVGSGALSAATSGNYNVALGRAAGVNISTGSGNLSVCTVAADGNSSPVYSITTEDNRIAMGHTAITNAYVQVAWTVVSDARDKTNFGEVPHGLEFVNQLKPVSFQFRKNRGTEETNGPVRYGFLAQDILELEGDTPVIIDNEHEDKLRYQGESLVPVLVNAIKELKAENDILKARLDAGGL